MIWYITLAYSITIHKNQVMIVGQCSQSFYLSARPKMMRMNTKNVSLKPGLLFIELQQTKNHN